MGSARINVVRQRLGIVGLGKPGITRNERLEKTKGYNKFIKDNPNASLELLDENSIYNPDDIIRYDEERAEGIAEPRVEGFSKFVPQKITGRVSERGEDFGKYKTTSEPVNVDSDLFTELNDIRHDTEGTSQLSETLEDRRVDKILEKERGTPESFTELFTRKFGARGLNKNPAGKELKVPSPNILGEGFSQAVISKPNAKRWAKSARIQTARQRLADIFDVIEGGGKIKPTKFLTPRGEASSVGHSFKTKTTPKNYLNLTHAGWSTTDDFSTSNIRPQGTKGIHKPSGWGEKGKEIFRGDERGSVEFIRRKIRRGDPIVHPSLNVFSPGETRTKAEAQDIVAGHAGRHRARALHEEGVKEMPVSVFSTRKDKDLVPTKLPTTPEEGLDIGWYSEGQKTIDEMKHGPRPVSARIQMARERLGAVGKVKKIKEPIDTLKGMNLREFKKRGIKLKKPEELFNTNVTDFTGSHFLSPEGKISRNSGPHQDQLDIHSIKHDGVRSWLKESGAVRIKAYLPQIGGRGFLNVENHTKLTEPQIEQISRFINEHKLEMNGSFAHDNFANDFEGSDEIVKRVDTLAKDYRGSYTFPPEDKKMMLKKTQKTEPKTQRTHTQNLAGKLKQRLGAIGKVDWSKIISKQVKPKSYIPSIGAGFLGPKGEYFDLMEQADLYGGGHGRWLQDILKSTGDKSLMKKYDPELQESITPWLEDSGMIRLRHTDQSSVGIESHSTPTSAQIRSLKTYIKDYDFDTDNLLVDDYTNSGLEATLSGRNRYGKLRQRIEAI